MSDPKCSQPVPTPQQGARQPYHPGRQSGRGTGRSHLGFSEGPGGSPARLFPLLLASAEELAPFIVCRSGNVRLGDGFLDNSEFCDLVVSFKALQSK